jgi:hypothetical protein
MKDILLDLYFIKKDFIGMPSGILKGKYKYENGMWILTGDHKGLLPRNVKNFKTYLCTNDLKEWLDKPPYQCLEYNNELKTLINEYTRRSQATYY